MNIIDLFAGCGGLSLGFEMAGFNIPVAIEKDDWASETYKKNHPTTKVITADITQILDLSSILPDGIKTIDGRLKVDKELRQHLEELEAKLIGKVI